MHGARVERRCVSPKLHSANKLKNTSATCEMHNIHAPVLSGPEFFISQE